MLPDQMPCSAEAEGAVIGTMLLDRSAAEKIAALLTPEDFYNGKNFGVFKTLSARLRAGQPLDGVLLTARGALSQSDFAGFVDSVSSTAAWPNQARLLRELRQRRDAVTAGRRLIRDAFAPDADTAAMFQRAWADLARTTRLTLDDGDGPDGVLDRFEAEVRSWGDKPFARSGVDRLDRSIGGGVLPGGIVTLVGGEGTMKTSLALSFAETYLREVGQRVLYLSLDMKPERIALRRLLPLAGMSERRMIAAIREDPDGFREVRQRRAQIDRGRFRLSGGPMELKDVESAVAAQSPGLVIWDFLTATAGFANEMECQRACVEALRAWQTKFPATWLVLSQMSEQSKLGQRQGDFSGKAAGGNNLARVSDTLIELFLDEPPEPNACQLANNVTPPPELIAIVAKCRTGQKGSMWALGYDGPTMSFTGDAQRVRREKQKKAQFRKDF
ncbi:DnaB-like helicase N-terminal domain-containing protein [Pyramidobacter piscolens]|uniref:DnaB-like helicase N-terminal domain-containing protein n=1 Tax=Pyramidobacter piscolens TaxID=638849 RepID=UPI00266CD6C7|nr:DnaB-like helicase N-terminal domain-containing protein [Pyramidobacter piscolens]